MSNATTTYTAAHEVIRRAWNKANKPLRCTTVEGIAVPNPNPFLHLSGAELKGESVPTAKASTVKASTNATAKATKAKVRTRSAWNEPGPRGGDPVKRLRGELASTKAEKGTPEWWAAYRESKDMTLNELGVALGHIPA